MSRPAARRALDAGAGGVVGLLATLGIAYFQASTTKHEQSALAAALATCEQQRAALDQWRSGILDQLAALITRGTP